MSFIYQLLRATGKNPLLTGEILLSVAAARPPFRYAEQAFTIVNVKLSEQSLLTN